MRLDYWLPTYNFSEKHRIEINSSPEKVFQATRTLDMGESGVIKALVRLRYIFGRLALWRKQENSQLRFSIEETADKTGLGGLGARKGQPLNLPGILLEEVCDKEIVLGFVGKFWKPSGGVVRGLTVEDYLRFDETGFCKVAWNIYIEQNYNGNAVLSTETRILCLGWRAKLLFGVYWAFIRLFSGWIRIEMLRMIKRQAEGENLI